MAWIESHVDIGDHPKTFELAERLGIGVAQAVGHLHLLWHFTLKFAWQDGSLERFSRVAVARGAHWDGDAHKFIEALQASGWLDGLKIHDWMDFCGDLVKKKIEYLTRKRERFGDFPKILGNSQHTQPNQTNHTQPNQQQPCPTGEGGTNGKQAGSSYSQDFLAFWAAYPRKAGKGAAWRSWLGLRPSSELAQRILEAVAAHSKSEQWQRESGRFIPHPATWLNQKRWEDEIREERHPAGAAKPIPGKYEHLG